jgi:hypothetical protein
MNSENVQLKPQTQNNLPDIILGYMNLAQKIHKLNSADKKIYVLHQLKSYIGSESYERYEPLIMMIIDTFKALARNKSLRKGLKSLRPNDVCIKNILSCSFC